MNKISFTLLLCALMTSSCGEEAGTGTDLTLKEIRLYSGIMPGSRAVYDGDVDISGLQFIRKDAEDPVTNFTGCTPFAGNRATGGAITFAQTQYYHVLHNTYIASYFPLGTPDGDGVRWNIDGKTDIMTADVVNTGSNAAPVTSASLSYLHHLAQIEVICKAADFSSSSVSQRWGRIMGIKLCDTPTSAAYLYNGLALVSGGKTGDIPLVSPGYTADFAPIDIPASTNATVNAVGMFLPSASQTFVLEVSTEKEGVRRVVIDLGKGHSLERSKKHIITLTFKSDIAQGEIVASSTIEAWDDGASGSGNV